MTSAANAIEALIQQKDGRWCHFVSPVEIVHAWTPQTVVPAIARVEQLAVARGCHAVGFVTYEAGAAFGLQVHRPPEGLPLAWFAIFDMAPICMSDAGRSPLRPDYDVSAMTPSVDRQAFDRAFQRIRRHIADGDTYQVNYTFRLDGAFSGDPKALYADLAVLQRSGRSIYLHTGDLAICSASPELFFSRAGTLLTTRPMKGTAPRGPNTALDLLQRDRLRGSPKERAENVMIVDMMRNDVGRVAEVGSVSVPELLTVERYPTLWQMTSTITGTSRASLPDIFAALHPSASVTGAPKVRTMQIIAGLETGPRGIYTGAIGHVAPGGDACFNVAIRTAAIEVKNGTLSYGIGSGIVWDSDAAAEYDECLLKAAVLGGRPQPFELLETMRWTHAEGFFLLPRHLDRLQEAAGYFGFACDLVAVRRALADAVAGYREPLRVRLLVSAGGEVRVECFPLAARAPFASVGLAREPIDPRDPFVFHKTTRREIYERARRAELDDTILWNRCGEVTESTVANVVVELDGSRVTPPVACGLLAGTFRAELLARGEIVEGIVRVDDLPRARHIWLINSVQGWRRATLVSE